MKMTIYYHELPRVITQLPGLFKCGYRESGMTCPDNG
jgi:hypothetical protein